MDDRTVALPTIAILYEVRITVPGSGDESSPCTNCGAPMDEHKWGGRGAYGPQGSLFGQMTSSELSRGISVGGS